MRTAASKTSTSIPARASPTAQTRPAMPPPTMATVKSFSALILTDINLMRAAKDSGIGVPQARIASFKKHRLSPPVAGMQGYTAYASIRHSRSYVLARSVMTRKRGTNAPKVRREHGVEALYPLRMPAAATIERPTVTRRNIKAPPQRCYARTTHYASSKPSRRFQARLEDCLYRVRTAGGYNPWPYSSKC